MELGLFGLGWFGQVDPPIEYDRLTGATTMKKLLTLTLASMFCGSAALATDLNLVLQAPGGASEVSVAPGETVNYELWGTLSDTANGGLALWGATLSFDGGDLPPANVPAAGDLANSVRPAGITNPDDSCPPACGYAGTVIAGDLVQCGGGQNTIKNVIGNAAFPIGSVIEDIGKTSVLLLSGSLTAPAADGAYLLSVGDGFANVIVEGSLGDPFFPVVAAGVVVGQNFIVNVGGCVPPQVVAWESVGTHGRGVGDVGLEISAAGTFSEPRFAGISKLLVTFDAAIAPPTTANVTVVGCDGAGAVDVTGSTMTVSTAAGATEMIIEFSPKLPDLARYVVELTGLVRQGSTAGVCLVEGDLLMEMSAVLGDATGDRRVTAQDVGGARSFVGVDPIDATNLFHVRSDATMDGRITAQDVGGIRAQVGHDARTFVCP